MRENDHSAEK